MIAIKDLGGIYRTAYADLMNMAREMWPALLILCALFVLMVMGYFTIPLFVTTWLGRVILRMLIFIGAAYAAAPYYVALHRFVAFGEVKWIPRRDAYGAAVNAYVGYAGFNIALWFAPLLLNELLTPFGLDEFGAFCVLAGLLGAWVLAVRLTTLLPMAVLDPRHSGWAGALAQSRGRFWFLFIATNGAAMPAMLALLALNHAAATRTITYLPFWVFSSACILTLQLIPLAVGTRLYQRFAVSDPIIRQLSR